MSRKIYGRLAVAIAICGLALPAVAQAELHWQVVADPAPGGQPDDYRFPPHVALGVAARTPYVASLSFADRHGGALTVARPNRAGSGWVQLGGVLNHDPTQLAFEPDLTESGSTPWITWSERDGQGGTQVRLARLVGNSFREVVGGGRAIGDGSSPQVVLYGGRPYVTYIDSTQNLRVVRPSWNMRTFEHVELGIGLPGSTNAKPLVSGGRLYVVYDTPGADPGTFDTRVGRLNSAGTRMEKISSSSRIGVYVIFYSQVAWARQVAYRSYGKDSFNGPGANRLLIVEAFLDDEWQAIPSPSTPGYDVQRSQLVGSDGTLWIIWDEGQAAMSPQRLVHVAKLVGTP